VSEFYDRQGNPLSLDEWVNLEERRDPEYKRVAETTVGHLWVSTVWLGLNHAWNPNHRPLIFETMIFPRWNFGELYMDRYSTEAEALAGHEVAVAYARKRNHGLTKHARDERREQMKRLVRLLDRKDRTEMEDMSLRLMLGRHGR